ncbi:MAG TPA: hypothetical protein PK522_00805 [Nitrosomonas sp.]|nr:hypothetical protein [Nitrosomonas sp.]
MKKAKAITAYGESDISEIIKDIFSQMQSPEGQRFKAVHMLDGLVMINIHGKTFLINVSEKDSLN